MSRTINFVQSRQKKLSKVLETDKKYLKGSTIFLLITCCVVILTLIARIYVSYSLESLKNRKERVLQDVALEGETERRYLLFVNKLQLLTELFGERKDKQEAIDYFSEVFGPDVSIKEITYSSESQNVAFTLQAKDIFTLEKVYETFNSQAFRDKYTKIEKTGLQRNNTGSYIMDLRVYLDADQK